MFRTLTLCLVATVMTGCSASIKTSKIKDVRAEDNARGLRYFMPQRVEVSVYRVTPLSDGGVRINRIGDVMTDTIPDPKNLWQVEYEGALFVNENLTLAVNDKGAVKSIGLTNSGSPPAVGALQAVQKGLETQRDFEKTREQARIDELTREANLIKAKKELEELLNKPK